MSVYDSLYELPPTDFSSLDIAFRNSIARPSVLMEPRKEKYRCYYKSKWANLKFFLQDKSSLEASVALLKTKTIEQFSSKCREIYRRKIEIQLMSERNRRLIRDGIKLADFPHSDEIEISDGVSGLPTDAIPTFLFMFRENNHLMLKLIDKLDKKKIKILVPFLCHFFYENFYTENMEQDEIIYLVYLLLEKEIDELIIPCEENFIDDSFLSEFLKEMGSRYEIKNYIDIILNDLICILEETHITFYSLDLNNDYIYSNAVGGKSVSSGLKHSVKLDYNITFMENSKVKKTFLKKSSVTYGVKSNNSSIIDFLPEDSKFEITQKYLTELYFKEKNECVKQFLFKHLKKIRTAKNPVLFDCSQFNEYLKKKSEKIPQLSAINYKTGFQIITEFITKLLNKLENDTIIPYSIKVICQFINILIRKKFKTISRYEQNNFISRFLFDKLIFPVLINPERSDIGKDRLISLATRKNLFNIYLVLKNLVKGELFDSDKHINFVVFNKFILENYHKINSIIEKITDVKMPDKLRALSNKFYSKKDFILDNSTRSKSEINYEYFEQNKSDFMQHKSICFTINELNMFYEIVEDNKDLFCKGNPEFEKTFETLSNFISMIKGKPNQFFVIISDLYNQEAQELLFHKEESKPLGHGKTREEIIQNLHYCISHLISNLDILPHWDWVNDENYKTMDTFVYINKYLNSYEGIYNFYPGSVPLNWYSLYIINNLNVLKKDDSDNDYQPLYNTIESQITKQHKKLSRLNEFLTVNMTTKFLLIDNKIKIFEEEYKNVKNTYINIKLLQIMESKELPFYLANVDELKKNGVQIDAMDNITGYNNFILQKQENIKKDKTNKKNPNEIPKDFLCLNINHFISQFLRYHKFIYEDISKLSLYDNKPKNNKNLITPEFLAANPETKAKEILDKYLEAVYNFFIESQTLQANINLINEDENCINLEGNDNNNQIEEENTKSPEEIGKKSILNYILKTLYVTMLIKDIAFKEDMEFNKKCKEFENIITLEDLKIPEEIYDPSIFDKIVSHIKMMDNARTPEEMLKEFELAVQLINSLFIFMMDKKETGSDNLTPVIIYVIIKAKPARLNFNIKFIKYFFDEKDKKGKNEYYIIQAITSIDYIMKTLKIDLKEKNKSKNKEKNNDTDDVETPAPTPFD